VSLGARDLDPLNQAAERIRGNGGQALAVRTDVSNDAPMRGPGTVVWALLHSPTYSAGKAGEGGA
jgi:hypothetical protein